MLWLKRILGIKDGAYNPCGDCMVGQGYPFQATRIQFIILYAIFLHFAWALLLWSDPEVGGTTPLATLSRLSPDYRILTTILFGAGILALIAEIRGRTGLREIGLLLPQQFLLLVTALGALPAMITGVYPDGTIKTPGFIQTDQISTVAIALFHTFALVWIHGGGAETVARLGRGRGWWI